MSNEIQRVPAETIQWIESLHVDVLQASRSAVDAANKLGGALDQIKSSLPWGDWDGWCEKHLSFSKKSADTYIRVYKKVVDNELLIGKRASKMIADRSIRGFLKLTPSQEQAACGSPSKTDADSSSVSGSAGGADAAVVSKAPSGGESRSAEPAVETDREGQQITDATMSAVFDGAKEMEALSREISKLIKRVDAYRPEPCGARMQPGDVTEALRQARRELQWVTPYAQYPRRFMDEYPNDVNVQIGWCSKEDWKKLPDEYK